MNLSKKQEKAIKNKTTKIINKALSFLSPEYKEVDTFYSELTSYLQEEHAILEHQRKLQKKEEKGVFDWKAFQEDTRELTEQEKEELETLWQKTDIVSKQHIILYDGTKENTMVFTIGGWSGIITEIKNWDKDLNLLSESSWGFDDTKIAEIADGLGVSMSCVLFESYITFVTCRENFFSLMDDIRFEYEKQRTLRKRTSAQRKRVLKKHSIDLTPHIPTPPSRKKTRHPRLPARKAAVESLNAILKTIEALSPLESLYHFYVIQNVVAEAHGKLKTPQRASKGQKLLNQALKDLCSTDFSSGFTFDKASKEEFKRLFSKIQVQEFTVDSWLEHYPLSYKNKMIVSLGEHVFTPEIKLYHKTSHDDCTFTPQCPELFHKADEPELSLLKERYKEQETTLSISHFYYGLLFMLFSPLYRYFFENNEDFEPHNIFEYMSGCNSALIHEIKMQISNKVHDEDLFDEEPAKYYTNNHIEVFQQLEQKA